MNKGQGLNWDKFKTGPQLSKYVKHTNIFNQRKSIKLPNLKDENAKESNLTEEVHKEYEAKWIVVLFADLDPLLPTKLTIKCRCVEIPNLETWNSSEQSIKSQKASMFKFKESCIKAFPDGKAIKSFVTKEGDCLNEIVDIIEYKENCINNFKDLDMKHDIYDNPDYCYIIACKDLKLNQNIKELLNLYKHIVYKKISKEIEFYKKKISLGEISNIK